MKSFFIGGVNGVGKSSIIYSICKVLSHAQKVADSSDFMEYLGLEINNYDTLRLMDSGLKNYKYEKFVREIISKNRNSNNILLFDGHYLNFIHDIKIDVTGNWMIYLDELILIDTTTNILYNNILKDMHIKDREILKIIKNKRLAFKRLSLELSATRDKYRDICKVFGKNETIIYNNRSIDNSVDQILEIITKS